MSVEHDIERAIDDVAREMTACEPDGRFKTRVLARIESGDTMRRRWRAAWIIAPLTAAAAIVIAVLMMSSHRSPERLALQQPDRPAVHPDEKPVNNNGPTVRPTPGATVVDRGAQPVERTEGARAFPASAGADNGPASARLAEAPEARRRQASVRRAEPSDVAAMAPAPLSVVSIAIAPIGSANSLQLPQLAAPPPLDIAPLATPNENPNENLNENPNREREPEPRTLNPEP